jgi:hypothetical protein
VIKFMNIITQIKRIRFIEMSLGFLVITVIAIYIILIMKRLHVPSKGDPIITIAKLLIINCAPASFLFGFLGIFFDKRKLLAIITTCVAGIPSYFIIYSFIDLLH